MRSPSMAVESAMLDICLNWTANDASGSVIFAVSMRGCRRNRKVTETFRGLELGMSTAFSFLPAESELMLGTAWGQAADEITYFASNAFRCMPIMQS